MLALAPGHVGESSLRGQTKFETARLARAVFIPSQLAKDYAKNGAPVLKERLSSAGRQLAALLNGALTAR